MSKAVLLYSDTVSVFGSSDGTPWGGSPNISVGDVSSLLFIYNVTHLSTSGTFTVDLDVLDSGANWINIFNDTLSSATAATKSIGPGLAVNMVLPEVARLRWIGGNNATATVTLSVYGR